MMMTILRSAAICMLVLGACSTEAAPLKPALQHPPETLNIRVDRTDRKVLIEAPITPTSGPVPLVLVFHGGGGSADYMRGVSQSLSRQLRANGYMVAYLNGSGRGRSKNLRTWNADHCCAYAARKKTDDAAFASAFVDEIRNYAEIDMNRIFLLGHSNGAMVSYRIAPRLNFIPAGLVIISGAMFADQPALPPQTSVLAIHTKDDESLSFTGDGDRTERFRTDPILPFETVGQRLLEDQQCGPAASSRPASGTMLIQASCAAGSEVALLVADKGGHKWPKEIPGLDLEAAIISFMDATQLN